MKRVYQAANSIEAHMIVHLLEQAGVQGHVQGEHLQSGAGELPVGLVAVAVNDEDVEAAQAVIREWESRQAVGAREASPPPKYAPAFAFFLGAVLTGGVVWSLYNGPEESSEVDHNGDGRTDERSIYSGNRLERIDSDRNYDGTMDAITKFAREGSVESLQTDDDFDGVMDGMTTYRFNEPVRYTVDWDQDGAIDYRENYEHGALRSIEYLDRTTGRVVKRVIYEGTKAARVELDLDGDGHWERSYALDRHDEPVEEPAEH